MTQFSIIEFDQNQGRLVFAMANFDFDSFTVTGKQLVSLMDANIVEQQMDADLHSWLIDFEGSLFILRAEHYSNSVWLEALTAQEGRQELAFIASLFQP